MNRITFGEPKRNEAPSVNVRPPTESGNPASALSNVRCYDTPTGVPQPSHDWLIPSGVVAGDGILAFINSEDGTVTPPSGYTLLNAVAVNYHYVYWKIADGTESDTTFTTSVDSDVAAVFGRIPANGATLSTPDLAEGGTATTSTMDPPAVTPAGGAGTYHIVSALLMNKGAPDPDAASAVSSGYTHVIECSTGGGVLYPWVVVQQKPSTAVVTTEDPGTYAWSSTVGSRIFRAYTLAIAVTTADPSVVGYPVTASDIDTESATDGQVLTSDGAGNAAWEDVPGGVTDHGALTGLSDDDHTQYILADGTRAFTGDQSMGSNKLTNVTDPTSAQDAATKAYVDANGGASASDAYIWRPLLDDEGAIVTDDEGAAVMGFGPA